MKWKRQNEIMVGQSLFFIFLNICHQVRLVVSLLPKSAEVGERRERRNCQKLPRTFNQGCNFSVSIVVNAVVSTNYLYKYIIAQANTDFSVVFL